MKYVFPNLDCSALLSRADFGFQDETVDPANRKIYRSFQGQRVADAPRDIFRLRHEVYCVEYGFLDPEKYYDGLEVDEYDDCSMHIAAYTTDESLIGTVRLVQPASVRPFPFEMHCKPFADFRMPPRELCGEVSRLAVNPNHRRRRADCVSGIPGISPGSGHNNLIQSPAVDRRDRTSPMLLLGMYREMYRYSRHHDVRYWFAAMERSLAYSLSRMGFRFEPIGPVADYYGAVTPYMLNLADLAVKLPEANPALSAWFNERPLVFARERLVREKMAQDVVGVTDFEITQEPVLVVMP